MLSDLFRLQLDLLGARGELAAGIAGGWLLHRATPKGGGNRPVITIPGFLASENTLLRLNRYLNRHGFAAEGWGLGRNLGPRQRSWSDQLDDLDTKVGARIRELAEQHSAPVALVGQSLGGVYARELAVLMPDYVDRVIMLGAPSFHPYLTTRVNRIIGLAGYWMSRRSHTELGGRAGLLHWDAMQPPLPCVSVHSPADGVVDEASSVIPKYIVERSDDSAPRENLRVFATHVGMSVNPWVMLAVADRLVADRDNWECFDPYRYFPASLKPVVELLFPPADASPAADIAALTETAS